jgi:hypothetical protein
MKSWNSKVRLATSYSSGCSDFKPGLPSIDAKELHMRLRVLLPDQFKPQRRHLWQFREYSLKFPMPNGGIIELWFRGEKLRVTLSPPANDAEEADNAA